MPHRIQLSRGKGWRKPFGAVVVARPSPWGNPFQVGAPGVPDRATAVELFRAAIILADHLEGISAAAGPDDLSQAMAHQSLMMLMPGPVPRLQAIRRHLRGKVLACWCPLDCPCHADVLLALANAEGTA
jgi:hypothetical protein